MLCIVQLCEFQEEAAKANQDAISFYNARKEKLNKTLKKFEEDELRAKHVALAERFLVGIKTVSGSLSCTAYKTIIAHAFRGIDGTNLSPQVVAHFISSILKCTELSVEDLQPIIAVCSQFDPTNGRDLQSLHSQGLMVIEQLRSLIVPVDSLSPTDMQSLGSTLSGLLAHELGSRLVHPVVQQAKSLLSEIRATLEQLQQQSTVKPAVKPADKPKTTTATTATAAAPISSEKSHLSYVEEARAGVAWLQKLERSSENLSLPSDVSASVDRLISLLQFGSKGTAVVVQEEDGFSMDGAVSSSSSSGGGGAVPDVVDILKALSECLPSVIALGSGPYIKVFTSMMQVILSEVQTATSEASILLYAALLTGVFEALPSSMVKESSKIVRTMLVTLSRVCVPDYLPPASSSASVKGCDEKSIRVLTLQSALIGRSPYIASPLSAEEGWTWLVRSCKQLSFVLANGCSGSSSSGVVKATLINDICRCVRVMLKFSGFALFLRFQERLTAFLASLAGAISKCSEEEAVKLTAFLAKNKMSIPPLYHDQQTPLALKAQELTRYVDMCIGSNSFAYVGYFSQLAVTRGEVALIDQDKSSQIFDTIRQHQIDRLRVIFNKLSATVESQSVAVASLLEKLLVASKVSPELLRYTLFKISNNIISDSQEEVFNETDEGHPTKLARVSCGLCREIQDLSSVIQAQFYDQCPLTIPRSAKEGLEGEDFLLDLRFRKKKSGAWEDKQQWLTRMTKILSTFAVIVVQPEQIPFSLLDGWRWLASIVNAACVSTASTPPFYVATALEVFLRIASPKMLAVYGDAFMQLLRAIQGTLLPRMSEEMPRRQCLQEFLQRFIDSNGHDFMTLFQR